LETNPYFFPDIGKNSPILIIGLQGDATMSTGFQGKFHRQHMLSRFAKELVRRSRSRCELCGENGVKLDVYELLPLAEEPFADGCVFICDGCRKQVVEPSKMIPSHWRCLNNALYSDVPAVQVLSVRILRRLAATEHYWAKELLEHAYLDPALEEWAALD
jgi:protein PhnA